MNELDRRRSASGLLAAFLSTMLVIGYRSGLQPFDLSHTERQQITFRVDVNSADTDELLLLPGVGPTIAQRIMSFRAENGSFSSCEDLRQVHGIGPKTVERLRPYLLFEDREE